MSTSNLLIGALLIGGIVLFMQSQKSSSGSSGSTPATQAPGFGFNLGFFKSDKA